MLRSISKQSRESVKSVWKKKSEATVGRICRKGSHDAKVQFRLCNRFRLTG